MRISIAKMLWRDETGFIVSSELVLLASVILIPMLVGMQTVRDSVVQELGDVGGALGSIVQSYGYQGVEGHYSFALGSQFYDRADQCETNWSNNRNCLNVGLGFSQEGSGYGPQGLTRGSSQPLIWDSGIRPGPPIIDQPSPARGELSLPAPDYSNEN